MSDAATRSPADLVEQGRNLHREGRLDEAERLYTEALAADEECAEAHQLMAVIAGQRGRFEDAIAGFRRAIGLEGPTPERLFNLAEAYRVTGQFEAALNAYNQVVTIDAGFVDAYRNCAAMVEEVIENARATGDPVSSTQLAKLAAHYFVGLGHACLRTHNVSTAENAYRAAITHDPGRAEAHNALGTIALVANKPSEAEMHYRRAHELEPGSPLYLNNVGVALLNQVRTTAAAELFRSAIKADPSFADARTNLEERMLRWLHYRSDLKPSEVFAAHRDWGRQAVLRETEIAGPAIDLSNWPDPERPLRVAYVGVDAGSNLMNSCLVPLIVNHDPEKFFVAVYAPSADRPEDFRAFRQLVKQFQPLSLRRPKEIAKMMRETGLDIVIDIAGHAPFNRLDVFALKPAPVTISWLGYPDTTGLSTIDYRLTDHITDPPGAENLYTEQLYRMGGGYFVYRPPAKAPDVAPIPARAPGAVTFGNFDDPRKISPETVQTWSSVLRALPKSRLVLMAAEFADAAFSARLHSEFRAAGVDPVRIELRQPRREPQEDLGAYAAVDISLDTFPYNVAPTTICESLWMGVPVITLTGDRPCARTSTSVLSQVGLERLDSLTLDEFVETAIELAQDLDRLRTLRTRMRDRLKVSPLMDERDFARRFEAALRDMWRRWCRSVA